MVCLLGKRMAVGVCLCVFRRKEGKIGKGVVLNEGVFVKSEEKCVCVIPRWSPGFPFL